ncbi:MAG TPA: hypothetical protein VJ719_04985 [Chthoniobacterales bacterium]|nr:hypothetical protein [Chthoniobacterales bacterium]
MRSVLFRSLFALIFLVSADQSWAILANAWHIPDNSTDVGVNMRNPRVEFANNTQITIYSGVQKFNNSFGTANQTGGGVYYKGATQNTWSFVGFDFNNIVTNGNNQYWRAYFTPSAAGIGANEVIQYYLYLTFDSGAENTYIYAPTGLGDRGGNVTNQQSTAATSPYTIRNRPGWIFHANNRVNSGSDVRFWAKLGYIGDTNDVGTRWADNGVLYYTTDGSDPVPGSVPGTAGNASTQLATFTYDHPENSNQNGGSQSLAGTAMWWVATGPNLLNTPLGTTIKYKVGFWHSSNSEQKFGDYMAGDPNYLGRVFSFTNGMLGDPVLTVNGLNANYTTTHVFVDETLGDSIPFVISFAPGQANVTEAEVFTNLNRRDKATVTYTNGSGFQTEEGIQPFDNNLINAGDDTHYYKAYPMNSAGAGTYTYTINATKTGAYRLTARWKVQGDPNWRYYTNIGAGRRDHAIVVSPVDVLKINLYEVNVFNLDAGGPTFAQRGTLEDLYDAPNAPHQGADNRWNLNYVKDLGCNWLWFQPIHPITQEAQQGHDPGSPYSVRNFFEINPLMSVQYNSSAGVNDAGNRAASRAAFQGLVNAANNTGVGIMLDAPFNHTAPDCEISTQGTSLFGNTSNSLFRDTEARFYSRDGNYAMRASGANNMAVAPDRGDFGKWGDVRDVYFGRYAALVPVNPNDNGNYNNEQDWFDYSIGNENSSGDGNGHFDQVTQNVWKYFSNYTLYWLDQTGVPAGSNLFTQTTKGIGGLRADFGQGLPPQLWEYIINKTRTRKWNFVFMAESLDGGAVTYRSNRHFDIENENIVFPLKSASNATDYRSIFESRRASYGRALVLLNNMSHDEEAFADPWQAVVRYAVCSTVDGLPLIFPGQELGISTTFGYSSYELNFGKNIANFKDFNSLQPAWNDNNFGNDQLYKVYSAIGLARLASPALRSQNRFFLNEDGNNQTIFGVAKYETKNGSPVTTDVIFAFANTNRDVSPQGNFHINHDTDNNGVNDYGIKTARTYDFKNIAAYTGFNANRRNTFLNRKTGTQLLNDGIFVAMNKVPTNDGDWATAPYEAQYLKVIDVTAPAAAPGLPTLPQPNAYGYAIDNGGVTYSWAAVGPDSEGIQPIYKVTYQVNNTQPGYFFTTSTSNTFQIPPGNTLTVFVQAVNPNDVLNGSTPTGPSAGSVSFNVISATGDNDGDGQTNAAEDSAGTNPFDSASTLHVMQLSQPDANSLTLTWATVPGKKYQVESAEVPDANAEWTAASAVLTANGSTLSATVPGADLIYYRAILVP